MANELLRLPLLNLTVRPIGARRWLNVTLARLPWKRQPLEYVADKEMGLN